MIGDRVYETTTTTGTSSLALLGAQSQYQAFSSAYELGWRVPYAVIDADGVNYEIGRGLLVDGTTIERTEILKSSNSNSAIALSEGTHQVFSAIDSQEVRRSKVGHGGPIIMETGLSLVDQGYTPQYTTSLGAFRSCTKKNVLNWVRRLCKNGFVILHTAGKSGDTTTGALARFYGDLDAAPYLPHWLNIWNGGNDINNIHTLATTLGISDYAAAEQTLATMKAKYTSMVEIANFLGINVIISVMPNNGLWAPDTHALWAQYEWEQWLIEFGRKNNVKIVNFNSLLCRAEYQIPATVTLLRNNLGGDPPPQGDTTTVTHTAHGYATGDVIYMRNCPVSFNTMADKGAVITVVNANSYTYANAGLAAETGTGTVSRSPVYQDLVADKSTHFSARGTSKAALMALPTYSKFFPPIDMLSACEGDFKNLIGAGKTAAQFRVSLGMQVGTGGTKSGTPLPTGSVGRSWEVAASTVSGGTEVVLKHNHTIPNTWSASASVSAGTFRRPTTATGFWAVSMNTASATTGSTEPVWPTRLGEQVVDGGVTWEMRLGWVPGTSKVYAAAEYQISAMDTDAIESLAFGIYDTASTANSIVDQDFVPETFAPLHYAGEDGCFLTNEAIIDASTTSIDIAMKVRLTGTPTSVTCNKVAYTDKGKSQYEWQELVIVTSTKTATVRLGRPTWRKVSTV